MVCRILWSRIQLLWRTCLKDCLRGSGIGSEKLRLMMLAVVWVSTFEEICVLTPLEPLSRFCEFYRISPPHIGAFVLNDAGAIDNKAMSILVLPSVCNREFPMWNQVRYSKCTASMHWRVMRDKVFTDLGQEIRTNLSFGWRLWGFDEAWQSCWSLGQHLANSYNSVQILLQYKAI
jgi:hypothetical protein